MEEYVTDALVLAKDSSGERDGRYVLFSERFGKIFAKAKSSRAIKSKLAGHLEPGTRVRVRFIDTGFLQVVDALKSGRTDISLENLNALKHLLPDMQADAELWHVLAGQRFSWSDILRLLGWDPRGAQCALCGGKASQFSVARQEFFCDSCVLKMGRNKVLYIKMNS